MSKESIIGRTVNAIQLAYLNKTSIDLVEQRITDEFDSRSTIIKNGFYCAIKSIEIGFGCLSMRSQRKSHTECKAIDYRFVTCDTLVDSFDLWLYPLADKVIAL